VPQPARKISKPPPAPPPVQESQKSAVREYAEAFGVALILAIILRTFFIQAYKIPSGSMEPTLLIGDHIIVNKLDYGFRLPDSIFGLTLFSGEIPYGKYSFFRRIRPRTSSSGWWQFRVTQSKSEPAYFI
jgi:signal peptidase I